jgi:hypothetical protein
MDRLFSPVFASTPHGLSDWQAKAAAGPLKQKIGSP